MQRFEGKNVLITGAAAGIGRATAERIAVKVAMFFVLIWQKPVWQKR